MSLLAMRMLMHPAEPNESCDHISKPFACCCTVAGRCAPAYLSCHCRRTLTIHAPALPMPPPHEALPRTFDPCKGCNTPRTACPTQDGVTWRCCGCGELVQAQTQTKFLDDPNAMVLHMLRTTHRGKDDRRIAYASTLDLSSYMAGQLAPASAPGGVAPAGPPHYKLCAVVVHKGEDTTSGHYTTSFRGADDSVWWV